METPWEYAERTNVHPDYRVVVNVERPSAGLVERFRKVHFPALLRAAHVSHLQLMDRAINPLAGSDWTICGPAVTVRLDYVDVLMAAAATKVCTPGDVVVVAAKGYLDGAVWGGALSRSAKLRGATGVVVDGMVGGTKTVLEAGLPVFCRGVHPVVGSFERPGAVNVPVVCGGVLVNPGDLVVGNQDGLAVIPRSDLERIIDVVEGGAELRRAALAQEEATQSLFFDAQNGMDLLRKAGVRWEE